MSREASLGRHSFEQGRQSYLHAPTLILLLVAQSDISFRSALNNASLVVSDGVGISLMGKVCRNPLGSRIIWEDYFFAALQALVDRGSGRVYFLGSSQRVLDLIAKQFPNYFRTLTLSGLHSPPYGHWGDRENKDRVQKINETKPDVLGVCMTAPKQGKWVNANRQHLSAPVMGSIGAAISMRARTLGPDNGCVRRI